MIPLDKTAKKITITCFFTIILLSWPSFVWAEAVEYDGLIEPYVVIDIGVPTEGIVANVVVDRGDPIEQDQVLVELESSVERAVFEKAENMASFDGDINLQQTQLAFAKRVYKRIKKLSMISTQDKDQAATDIKLTKYRLKKALEKRTLAELEKKKARIVLAQRSITSPISGVVVDRYISPGEYVNSQPVLRVAQIDPLRVEVIVPARMFSKIITGMEATVLPELTQYGEKTATVTIVDKVIDSASNTFGVRLELPNAEQQMPSGLKCLVRFDIQEQADETKKATVQIAHDQAQSLSVMDDLDGGQHEKKTR